MLPSFCIFEVLSFFVCTDTDDSSATATVDSEKTTVPTEICPAAATAAAAAESGTDAAAAIPTASDGTS